jgi:hypothetical protein
MATIHKTEKEIVKALGTGFKKQGAKEPRAKYLVRLAEALSNIDEDDYNSLSTEAKDWYDACVAAAEKKKEAPDFDDVKPSAKDKSGAGKKAKGKKADEDDEDDDSDSDDEDDEDDADDSDDEDDDSDSDDSDDEDDADEDDDSDSDDEDDEDDADDSDDEDDDSDADDEDSDDEDDDDADSDEDDDDAESPDEDKDDGDGADVASVLKRLKVGDKVKVKTDEAVIKGKVVKAMPRAVNVKGLKDGTVVKLKLEDIEAIEVLSQAEPADGEKNEKAGKERLSGTGEKIRAWLVKNYAITDGKTAMKKAEKELGNFNPNTFKLMFSECHKWIDAYKAHQKAKAK